MSVDILLRSLYVEDKMVEDGTDFRHLITSELDEGKNVDLVRIRYQGVQKTSPEFMTVHEGIDKVRLRLDTAVDAALTCRTHRWSTWNSRRSTSLSLVAVSCVRLCCHDLHSTR